jgi:enoyl-CoA hydratase/carnithine racemase
LISGLALVLDDVEQAGIENFVLQFCGGPDSVTGDFPFFRPDAARSDVRHFARWEALLRRMSQLKAKTFAAYSGRIGTAAIHAGFVMDLRLASAGTRLTLAAPATGAFPGMGAYWLPKFVGLGNARKMLLLGEELTAEHAAQLGLFDVVADTVEAAVDATISTTSQLTPEAAYFTRRILDEGYWLEHSAAAELAKAARFKLGMPMPEHQTFKPAYAREA